MEYHKLVRDAIPAIIRKNGETPVTHIASDVEYYEALKNKLLEEGREFAEADSLEELADILEVLYAILAVKNISREELEEARRLKAEKRGAFTEKIILEETRAV